MALEGAVLEVKYGKCGCPPGLAGASAGPSFSLALQTVNALTKGSPSNMAQAFTDEASYVALPLPTGWEGRVVLIVPTSDTSPDYWVRLTSDGDTFEIPLQGMLLIEAPRDKPYTEVAIKGSVTIGWLVTGQQA